MRRHIETIGILLGLLIAYIITSYSLSWWPFNGEADNEPTPTPSITASVSPTSLISGSPVASPLGTQRITDSANTFSVEVPQAWRVTASEGRTNKQISYTEITSPDFDSRKELGSDQGEQIYYNNGALLIVHVVTGTYVSPHETSILNSRAGVQATEQRTVGGAIGTYHRYIHPSTYQGQLLDFHITRNSRTYLLTFAYNPATYSQGPVLFDSIINSFRFESSSQ